MSRVLATVVAVISASTALSCMACGPVSVSEPRTLSTTGAVLQDATDRAGASSASSSALDDVDCTLPVLTLEELDHSFESYGPAVGEQAPDVALRHTDGRQTTLHALLAEDERPTLLMAASLTCPVARRVMPTFERIAAERSETLRAIVVYVIEPHPRDTPSPYSGEVWVTEENRDDRILERQPETLAERTSLAAALSEGLAMRVPVVVDDMCNAYWTRFGPAPNNAYVLRRDGLVLLKHGWFDQSPWDIEADLDTLLGETDGP